MTDKLRELAALEEKARQTRPVRVPTAAPGVWRTDHLRDRDAGEEFKDALVNWFRSPEGQRVFEDAERYQVMRENFSEAPDEEDIDYLRRQSRKEQGHG